MGIGKEYLASQHWNYFLSIESDLSVMARWVEFDPDNYKVYSLEMARLLLTACSEVDVIAKAICEALNSSFNRKSANLHTCGKLILETFPDVAQEEATIPRHGLTLNPWLNWKNVDDKQIPKSPGWWIACNGVKHNRFEEYKSASLENTLNAVSGLFILLTYYHRIAGISVDSRPTLLFSNSMHYDDIGRTHFHTVSNNFG